MYGVRNDQLDDLSGAYLEGTEEIRVEILNQLDRFDPDDLTLDQNATLQAFRWHLQQQSTLHAFRLHDWPVHFLVTSYNHGVIGLFTEIHPVSNRNDADDYLARLDAIDAQVEQVIDNLRSSVDLGVVPPRYVVDVTLEQLKSDVAGGVPENTAIYRAFESRIGALGLNDANVSDYVTQAKTAIEESFFPAWRSLIEYLEMIRDQSGTSEIGLSRLPDGEGYYAALLEYHTSTTLKPEQIHDIGWQQVDRITQEMRALGPALGVVNQDLGELRAAAREAGGFVADSEVVATYERLIADSYQQFEPYFSVAPTADLEVVTEDFPGAFYIGPAADGSRPGAFHAGGGGTSVAGFTMKSLSFHEAVPGHHFQVALAQELDLASPRKFWANTAHVEGWALYAERLGSDIGLYDSDVSSNFGRLDFELLRAARLVVDTGIHHYGWDHDRAVATLTEIMGGPEYNHEVDRYVVYPAQATAYMVGMLELLDLRDRFGVDMSNPGSVAQFHDVAIGNGHLPLPTIQWLIESLAD